MSYCGRSCQKADWKTHKLRCNAEVKACDARTQRGSAVIDGSRLAMRKSSSGAGAGASAGDDTGKEDGEEEECAICLEALVDPLAPCAEQPSHR